MSFSKRVEQVYHSQDIQTKLKKLSEILVAHTKFANALARMDECLHLSKFNNQPQCMMITGNTGLGKTTLITKFMERYPRTETEVTTRVPVFTADIPRPANIKGVISKMLEGLSQRRVPNLTVTTLARQLNKLLIECEVQMIILDEFQHLIERNTSRNTEEVSDWIKSLINDTKIPVVLCGLPSALDVLRCNEQLARRFPVRWSLTPFIWQEDHTSFVSTLRMIDEQLPFTQSSNLANKDMPRRLMIASGGNMSVLMNTIREAAAYAIHDGAPRIERKHFIDAYLQFGLDISFNPFEIEESMLTHIAA